MIGVPSTHRDSSLARNDIKRDQHDRYKVKLSWAIGCGYPKFDNLDKFVTEDYYPDITKKYAPRGLTSRE